MMSGVSTVSNDNFAHDLDAIQVMRLLSASLVLLIHAHVFSEGEWAVDLFFVISGFIIPWVAHDTVKVFFIKRIVRIAPLYWVATLAIAAIGLFKPSLLGDTTVSLEYFLKSIFFVPFDKNGVGFSPLLFLGWTLNYEVYFYLLFALSMRFCKQHVILCTSMLIIILKIMMMTVLVDFSLSRFYGDSIVLEFVVGMLLFQVWRDFRPLIYRYRYLLAAIFGAASTMLLFYNTQDRFLNYGLLASAVFVTIFVLLMGQRVNRFLMALGDAAFSVYITHIFIIDLFLRVIFPQLGYSPDVAARIILAAGCMIFGHLFYVHIESLVLKSVRKRVLSMV